MLAIAKILLHLEKPKASLKGQRINHALEDVEYLISHWSVQKIANEYVYEVHNYTNARNNTLDGASQLNELKIFFTKDDFAQHYQNNQERYFYNPLLA